MKRKLLRAMIVSALALTAISASAAGPTLYGRLNLGIAKVDNGNDADNSTLGVSDDASRLGVKGDEDLSEGLKAIYLLELGYDGDGSAGVTGAARDVYAGLQAGWGTIRLGQFNSAYKNLTTGLELFGDTIADFTTYCRSYGVTAGVACGVAANNTALAGETRLANAISYTSADFGGLRFNAESARGEVGTDLESNPTVLAVSYKGGPLYIGVGSYNADNQGTTGLDDATKVAVSFMIGDLTLIGIAERQSNLGTLSVANHEVDTNHFGVAWKLGSDTVAATWTDYSVSDDTLDSSQVAVGYFKPLSKNAVLKFVWTDISNEDGSSNAGRALASGGISLSNPAVGNNPGGFQTQLSLSF
jgi:predicted porin